MNRRKHENKLQLVAMYFQINLIELVSLTWLSGGCNTRSSNILFIAKYWLVSPLNLLDSLVFEGGFLAFVGIIRSKHCGLCSLL